ncbi:MAG: dienelactone hydrolase family protein [Acidimicrobiia bacterium]|nr:dienelactone hydrolase family protein [Acidimicrobiia bacterium]
MGRSESQEEDTLADFARDSFTYPDGEGGKTRTVLRKGEGPAVLVVSEVPGITPRVADFARRVVDVGATAVVPHLFGRVGKAPSAGYILQTMSWACVSREFTLLASGRTSPVVEWLKALARHEHDRCGGPGVGVVGMCLTGGFALAMMVDEAVIAPVLSQPSLPLPLSGKAKRDLGLDAPDLARVRARCGADPELCVLGLRFTNDPAVPPERFARLREELGDNFVAVEIDSSPGNPYGNRKGAHSVLTEDLQDVPGHPTRDALDRVLALFRDRLLS